MTPGPVHDPHAPRRDDEFAPGAAEWPAGASRREFLQRMAASLAFAGVGAGAACRRPRDEIVAAATEGEQRFATAITRGGYANGVVATMDGVRPRRLDGNPEHPTSLGAIGAIEQAAILGLFDPHRSRDVLHAGARSDWSAFAGAIAARLRDGGADRTRLLTGRVTSPTLLAQLAALRARWPALRWHRYEPIHDDGAREASRRVYGRFTDVLLQPDGARVVVSLGGDPLQEPVGSLAQVRAFARARRPNAEQARWYAIESTPSSFGTKADHRLALGPGALLDFARSVAAAFGIGDADGAALPDGAQRVRDAIVRDLDRHRGRGLVVAGRAMPAEIHELALRLQHALGNVGRTSRPIEPVEGEPVLHGESLRELANDLAAHAVDTLIVFGTNVVYAAPADLDFAALLRAVPFTAHLGVERDETAAVCTWHVPEAHELEAFGDCRAHDGTATIQQPLIEPLFGGRTRCQLLALLLGEPDADARALVAAHWRERGLGADFAAGFRAALRRGAVAGSASAELRLEPSPFARRTESSARPPTTGLELLFAPHPSLFDGAPAANAWLQELPDPLTKIVWGNAALFAPETARRLGVADGDEVELEADGRRLRAPVHVLPGQALECVTIHLGAGRTHAGPVGSGVGFSAYTLRPLASPWSLAGLAVRATGRRLDVACTQRQHEPRAEEPVRELAAPGVAAGARANASANANTNGSATANANTSGNKNANATGSTEQPSLYPRRARGGHAWGMAIDLQACVGCNACVIGCQAENNVPVVGKQQAAMGRAMHWLRVDHYELGPPGHGAFEPMACQHCENAPCEPVCPVGATVHGSEGLNEMVYNRCIGTRYCANNCPWKVRRFNFLAYAERAGEAQRMQRNRQVTVRARGVMEKCTYCVQRIEYARIAARREGRPIRDGEIVPACAAVCPTEAIVFGDVGDPHSRVSARKADPRDFVVLGHLNTRPRTSYAAIVLNRDAELAR